MGSRVVTTDGMPAPFTIQNDGNIKVNITVYANVSLFNQAALNTSNFQYRADNSTSESNTFNWATSNTTWENMSDAQMPIINELLSDNSTDEAESEISVVVPQDEGEGDRISYVYYIASDGR